MTDLSHWNALRFFSREQIAHLLAGVDPNGGPYPRAIEGKIALYRDLLDAAIRNALRHAWEHVRDTKGSPDSFAVDIFECDPWPDELPSYEIRCNVADVLGDPANAHILQADDPAYTEKFHRDDIHFWAISRELTKGYRFDGIANDRIPDVSKAALVIDGKELPKSLELEGSTQSQEDLLVLNARTAANVRHSKPGGSREKRQRIQDIWRSGKYSSRDLCAEQECAALEMSFSSARKALRGTPDPT